MVRKFSLTLPLSLEPRVPQPIPSLPRASVNPSRHCSNNNTDMLFVSACV